MASVEQKEELEDILLEFRRHDISLNEAVGLIESALHSVEAEKEPEWISCEDRLPKKDDGPKVWLYWEGQISLQTWSDVCVPNSDQWAKAKTYPAPPEHKPE